MTESEVSSVLATLEAKLPQMFSVKCNACGAIKGASRDVFLKRVKKLDGDYKLLMEKYICKGCRKEKNVDMIGRPKIHGGNKKVIQLDDLDLND